LKITFFYKHKHFGSYLMRWPNSSTCFYYRCYLSPSPKHTHTYIQTNTLSPCCLLPLPKNESHPIHFQSCSFSVYINTWPLYTLEKFLVLPLEWITILDLLYSISPLLSLYSSLYLPTLLIIFIEYCLAFSMIDNIPPTHT